MPILADSSFKNKKRVHPPLTVTFAMPTKEDSVHDFHDGVGCQDKYYIQIWTATMISIHYHCDVDSMLSLC